MRYSRALGLLAMARGQVAFSRQETWFPRISCHFPFCKQKESSAQPPRRGRHGPGNPVARAAGSALGGAAAADARAEGGAAGGCRQRRGCQRHVLGWDHWDGALLISCSSGSGLRSELDCAGGAQVISVRGRTFQCVAYPEQSGTCSVLRGSFAQGQLTEICAVHRRAPHAFPRLRARCDVLLYFFAASGRRIAV